MRHMETRPGRMEHTSDPDGNAFEDGMEAESGDEEYAVAEAAGVAQHGCRGVIAVCVLCDTTK